MAKVSPKRVTPRIEGDFVVFLIGMRINKAWKVIVQYWRSFEHLEAYAREPDKQDWPAWVDFNERVGRSRADVGIWHETYKVRAGEYECVYSGMPSFGLARASSTAEVVGHLESARDRLGVFETSGRSGKEPRRANP